MAEIIPETADVIVVGGGPAGCALAATIAESSLELDVVLIERGPHSLDHTDIINPALFGKNLSPTSGFVNAVTSKAAPQVNGRAVPVLTANVLGGASSINFMMYARPQALDFDSWQTPGWRSSDIESFETSDPRIDASVHGNAGPFHVGVGGGFQRHTVFEADCLNAAKQAGIPCVADSQDLSVSHGVSSIASWVDPKSGKRQDAAHVLIYPLLNEGHTNLHLVTDHFVDRVELDAAGNATGVIVTSTSLTRSEKVLAARRMVVLSAGALSTPQILERSGVGDPAILDRAGVPVTTALPGVGGSYLDHQFLPYAYHSRIGPENSLDDLWAGRASFSDPAFQEDGFLGWNGFGVIGKLRLEDDEVLTFDSSFQDRYRQEYPESKPLVLFSASSAYVGVRGPIAPGQYFSFATALAYGYSKGHIHIQSGDSAVPADFDAGFLSDEDDLKILTWNYKKTREVARRMRCYGGIEVGSHPKFDPASPASAEIDDPIVLACEDRSELKDIAYSVEDNLAIKEFIRQNVGTMWHSAGTCPMKSLEEGGVVDANLNVYGTKRLKVADLSILPSMVSANTYSTALLVGQKAAQILLAEL